MSLSQMQVFNEYIMPATIETLAQMVNKFNQASNGAIRLTTKGFDGDFLQESLKSVKPLPKQMPGVYMCNESWAYAQCWVKCAIDQADLCFKKMVEDSEAQ